MFKIMKEIKVLRRDMRMFFIGCDVICFFINRKSIYFYSVIYLKDCYIRKILRRSVDNVFIFGCLKRGGKVVGKGLK